MKLRVTQACWASTMSLHWRLSNSLMHIKAHDVISSFPNETVRKFYKCPSVFLSSPLTSSPRFHQPPLHSFLHSNSSSSFPRFSQLSKSRENILWAINISFKNHFSLLWFTSCFVSLDRTYHLDIPRKASIQVKSRRSSWTVTPLCQTISLVLNWRCF